MKICVATYAQPRDFNLFIEQIRGLADNYSVVLQGYVVVGSTRSCLNHGIMVEGTEENCERFADTLAMALMPAKWSRTSDEDPAIVAGQFESMVG